MVRADGLAATPPLGWNSWNSFSCEVTESDIRAAADALVDTGLREAGYEYVVVDDCWMAGETDSEGRLLPSADFPNGMAALADYVHDRGLKFGLYSSAGSHTCQDYPASLGHERLHAEQFAEWGVDYLKYDNCGDHRGRDAIDRYAAMGDALASVDRDIVYSICEWGQNRPWAWGRNAGGHLWRTADDLVAKWRADSDEFGLGVADVLDRMAALDAAATVHGPGGWNDPDMLQIGTGPESGQSEHEPVDVQRPLTEAERRTHFAFWCLLVAPLMIGADLTSLSDFDRELLTNERLLAIDQDPLGIQGTPDRRDGDAEVWSKRLADGGAVAFHNRGDAEREISTHVSAVDVPGAADRYRVCDCWTGTEWETGGSLAMTVKPRDTAIVRVTTQ